MNDQNKSLQKIEDLLRHILAVQLYRGGASQQQVAKHLKISVGKCNELLQGVQRLVRSDENLKSKNS
jgi:hypothetical protein